MHLKDKWTQEQISQGITPFWKVLDSKEPFSKGSTVEVLVVVKTEMTTVSLSSMKRMHCVTVINSVKGTLLIAVLITSHFAMKRKNGLLTQSLGIQKVGFGNMFKHSTSS